MGEKELNWKSLRRATWHSLHAGDEDWRVGDWHPADDDPRAYNERTGQNAAFDRDKGTWIDTKTGEPLTPEIFK